MSPPSPEITCRYWLHLPKPRGRHRRPLPDPYSNPRRGVWVWVRTSYNNWVSAELLSSGGRRRQLLVPWEVPILWKVQTPTPGKPSRNPMGLMAKGRGFPPASMKHPIVLRLCPTHNTPEFTWGPVRPTVHTVTNIAHRPSNLSAHLPWKPALRAGHGNAASRPHVYLVQL